MLFKSNIQSLTQIYSMLSLLLFFLCCFSLFFLFLAFCKYFITSFQIVLQANKVKTKICAKFLMSANT